MAVYVNIAVLGVVLGKRSLFGYLNAARFADGAFLVTDIFGNFSFVKGKQVGRFAGFYADHCPYGTGVADGFAFLVQEGEVTVGKQAIDILYPRLDTEILVLARHIFQFDSQAGKYPRIVVFIKAGDAKASVGGMEACTIQQMVA